MVRIENIPELRFAGFTDAWEQRKVKEVAPLQRGFDLPQTQMEVGPYPVVMSNGICNYHSQFMVKGPGVVTGRSGTIGHVHYVDKNYWPHNTSLWVYNFCGNNPLFIYYLYQVVRLEKFQSGSGVPTLNRNDVHGTIIAIPSVLEEQKIASLFRHLDNLISHHQRKYDALVKTKKALLEKMFPKGGEKTPQVRFAGFTDAWEQREVKDIFKVTRGYVLAATKMASRPSDENPYPVFSSQTKDNGLLGYFSEYLYENAITWTTDGANAGTVNYRSGRFYCTNVCGVLLSDSGYANKMIAEALNRIAWRHVSKAGNPKLMNNVMSEIVLQLPLNISEQDKISTILLTIDSLITLHQRKLEKLKKLKKAFLEKMFASEKTLL